MAFSTSPIIVAKEAKEKVIDPRDKKTLPKESFGTLLPKRIACWG